MSEPQDRINAFAMWIPSLAVSIVCCSVLFVVFADYLSDIKEGISVSTARIEMIERRTNQMRVDMVALAKRLPAPNLPVSAAPATNAQPDATPAVATPEAVAPVATTPAETTTAAPVAPSVAAPAVSAPVVAVPAVVAPPAQK